LDLCRFSYDWQVVDDKDYDEKDWEFDGINSHGQEIFELTYKVIKNYLFFQEFKEFKDFSL